MRRPISYTHQTSCAVTVAALAAALLAAAPVSAESAVARWTDIQHTHPADQQSYFVDSWSDGTDVWAAGYRRLVLPGVIEWRTWVQRCAVATATCAAENTLDIEGAPSVTYLEGVSGTSATDVWLAGRAERPGVRTLEPLIEHFDGSQWSVVTTPAVIGGLYGISAVSPDDAWAVGYQRHDTDTRPLVLHWDGARWTEETIAIPQCSDLQLWDIDATGPRPLAVGACLHDGGTPHASILSRGADSWSAEPIEGVNPRNLDVQSVNWTGTTAWVGGARRNHGVTLLRGHGTWTSMPTPDQAGMTYGFAGARSDDVWAVGSFKLHRRTMHWNGTSWDRVADPGAGWLESVSLASDGTPWAVGHSYDRLSVIQRYDGHLDHRRRSQ